MVNDNDFDLRFNSISTDNNPDVMIWADVSILHRSAASEGFDFDWVFGGGHRDEDMPRCGSGQVVGGRWWVGGGAVVYGFFERWGPPGAGSLFVGLRGGGSPGQATRPHARGVRWGLRCAGLHPPGGPHPSKNPRPVSRLLKGRWAGQAATPPASLPV